MQTAALEGGFGNIPHQSAIAFRAALRAMAQPGTIERVTGGAGPAPLSVAGSVLVLTLCDPQTPIHLAGAHDCAALREWIGFHTGAPLVAPPQAAFAIGTWDALAPQDAYPIGTPEYPDRSTTLIVEMPDLVPQGAVLRGPGIKDTVSLSVPDVAFLQMNARTFPLGLDFFLTHGDRLAALPRTTEVR